MKGTFFENKLEKEYNKKGYKSIRRGYPDFIFYKENSKGYITNVKFVEHKLNQDVLKKEQIIFKRICESLGLDYHLVKEGKPDKTVMKISPKLHKYLLDRGTKSDSYEDIIWRLIGMKKISQKDKKSLPSDYEGKLNQGKKKK